MVFGYCRVATKGEPSYGSGLDTQEQEIVARYPEAAVCRESYIGTGTHRPQLAALLDKLGPEDMLCVTKLDRLARSVKESIALLTGLFEKGVAVHVLSVGRLDDPETRVPFMAALSAIAEMERATLMDRTQLGKERARGKAGYQEGRPRLYTGERLDRAMKLLENKTYAEVAKLTQISESTLIRERRRRRIASIQPESHPEEAGEA